jgi:predicted membrane channel-forming protein YqfA (hemolysin III family)
MRTLVTTLSIILAIVGLVFSILPFGYIALLPIVAALIFGFIAFKLMQKEGKSTTVIKILFGVIIISLGLAIYNAMKPNKIEVNQETINKQKQNDKESLKELEDIDIEN